MKLKSLLSAVLLTFLLTFYLLPASLSSAHAADEDMAIGGIHIGMTRAEVEELYGAGQDIAGGVEMWNGEIVGARVIAYPDTLTVSYLNINGAYRVTRVSAGVENANYAEALLAPLPAEAQDTDARGGEHSVAPPVAWITLVDHVLTFYDENKKEVYRALYPALSLTDDSASPLARAFIAWNAEIGTGAWHNEIRSLNAEARAEGYNIPLAYTDITPITAWGRVDEQMVSFFMKGSSYAGGLHPFPHVDAYTFDSATGRQIALEEIVTGREQLLAAIAAAFELQYPGAAVGGDSPRGVMETLLAQHPAEKGLTSFCWYIGADGNLVIYYPVSTLTSYAAGDFSLTITRADAPELFTAAYPME